MMPDTPAGGGASTDLVRSIDRAVRFARGGRLLAACGGWVAVAAGVVAALAAIDVASGGRIGIAFLPWAAKITIVLVLAATVWCGQRWRPGLPYALGLLVVAKQYTPLLLPLVLLSTLATTIAAQRPTAHDGQTALTDWVADWRALIDRRATFAHTLDRDGNAEFVIPKDPKGAPITNRMNEFARTHALIGCETHNLQAETLDGPRNYPNDPTKIP